MKLTGNFQLFPTKIGFVPVKSLKTGVQPQIGFVPPCWPLMNADERR